MAKNGENTVQIKSEKEKMLQFIQLLIRSIHMRESQVQSMANL